MTGPARFRNRWREVVEAWQVLTEALADLAHDLLAELAAHRDTTIEELLEQYALLELRLAETDD